MRTFVRASAPPAARTLDAQWYISADVFARERRQIFSRSWICVGRAEQIAHAGDFLTTEIAGESLILTRDPAGAVHAFSTFAVTAARGCANRRPERTRAAFNARITHGLMGSTDR